MNIFFTFVSVSLLSCAGNNHGTLHLVNKTSENLEIKIFSSFDYPIKSNESIQTDSLFISAHLIDNNDGSIQIMKQDTSNFLSKMEELDNQKGSIISVYDDEEKMYHSLYRIAPEQRILIYRVSENYLKDSLVPISGLHISRMNATNSMELELNSAKDIYNEFHSDSEKKEIEISIDDHNLEKIKR